MNAAGVGEALAREGVLGILRYRRSGDLEGAVAALVEGGVRVFEITTDTPGALDAIAAWAGRDDLCVGAGTVTTADEVRRVADAGAAFVVSPGLVLEVVEVALDRGLGVLPGVATATEVLTARSAGVELFKLFPAGALGTAYLRQLRGPFPTEGFVPTGGVRIEDIGEWLEAGAYAVALGSDLAGRTVPTDEAALAELTFSARRAVAAVGVAGQAWKESS